ncbi:tetraspanin Tsp2 family [Laccaria bicolor S238N-H82]|uniref:Tetraspanin Tsp2 family n=1 Tax=Laccaria bicolor (strain S238N-H82 / ATCC MYA-4686) TaxID=486041 RepID=B0DP66_LACBS|nr:tetraspanin Tsp2 family [Laccaria bicolor S238N-H82]EDR03560.1 tetraspanin Tsp2 family [Laccaria bicolor S238N-H82]|eukprot:XP_001885708.1 tetraspanin Tsp2 family [Laccaria bicolor S238N-H82]
MPSRNPPIDLPNLSYSYNAPGSPSSRNDSFGPDSKGDMSMLSKGDMSTASSSVSLSVNYLPSKFSNSMLAYPKNRKSKKGINPGYPKMGGGVEAFRTGEARMGGENEDEDGVPTRKSWFGARPNKKLRWNRFKWVLFTANTLLTLYSLCSLIICLLIWFDVWSHADVVRVGNRPELVVSTLAASMGIFTATLGWAGIMMNNRSFLAVYTFLLWIAFIFLLVPGYLTYKRHTFNLEGKINAQWSRDFGADGRLRIQNQLSCCGYFSPFVEATVSQTCYARSMLQGCKSDYLAFERRVLRKWYTTVFSIVPVHIVIIFAGLLCSNHVTYRFGKGMMPKAYRLSMTSMAVIMDNYATQLAEQYGSEVASDIINRSRSNLHLDSMPTMPYTPRNKTQYNDTTKYDALNKTLVDDSI